MYINDNQLLNVAQQMFVCTRQQCDASEPPGSETVELPHAEEGAAGQRHHRPAGHAAHARWQK